MASTVDLWTPPAGMNALNVKAWRAFYAHIQDLYGMTPAAYRRLYVAQKGRCSICRTAKGIHPDDPNARGSRRLGVDHNHVSGRIRGLLCTGSLSADTCNRLIGHYTAAQLERAASYLQGFTPAYVVDRADVLGLDDGWIEAQLFPNERVGIRGIDIPKEKS